jgi:hypothetical protein
VNLVTNEVLISVDTLRVLLEIAARDYDDEPRTDIEDEAEFHRERLTYLRASFDVLDAWRFMQGDDDVERFLTWTAQWSPDWTRAVTAVGAA